MKQIVKLLGLILVISLVLTVSVWAQSQNTTGRGMGGGRGGFYDVSAVTTVNCTVVSVETSAGRGGGGDNIRLSATIGSETVRIMVGPANYLAEQKITINAKDKLKVKGSKMERNGNTIIVSAEITKGKDTWVLRDSTGASKWAPAAPAAPKTN